MNISEAAARSGLPPKTIRYYEEIGLMTPRRGANGYRAFEEADVHRLAFLARARTLGFTVEDCRALLALWGDRERASADVRRIASGHLARIERKIEALAAMRGTLSELVGACAGDERPDCPILRGLGDDAASDPPEPTAPEPSAARRSPAARPDPSAGRGRPEGRRARS